MLQKVSGIENFNAWEGGIIVLSNFFFLTGPKNFVEAPFWVSEVFWYRKKLINKSWGISHFSLEFFLTHISEKFRGRTLECFRKLRVSKNFLPKKGISLVSVEVFLSHSAEKYRRGTLLCFKCIPVSKIFMHSRGGDGASRYCRTKFCLKGPY